MNRLVTLAPHVKDLGGGFMVRRLLPAARRRAVGPFVFFDHFGPVVARPEDNVDVRPHPHIGLATVTYLYEGAMMHRDSLGTVQRIEPGAINWMSAGRGIVHSERTPDDLRDTTRRSHGLQLWVALPAGHDEDAPSFAHTPAAALPEIDVDGARVRVLVGSAFGRVSPVQTASPTLYLDLQLAPGATLELPALADEAALYGIDNDYDVDAQPVAACSMALLPSAATVRLHAPRGARIALVGGTSLGPRFLAWNFVARSQERITRAEADWLALTAEGQTAQATGRGFDPVPGESDFIPLPPRPAARGVTPDAAA
ncbi:MAG: pirin family protein [Burkholderiaceae bacterium]